RPRARTMCRKFVGQVYPVDRGMVQEFTSANAMEIAPLDLDLNLDFLYPLHDRRISSRSDRLEVELGAFLMLGFDVFPLATWILTVYPLEKTEAQDINLKAAERYQDSETSKGNRNLCVRFAFQSRWRPPRHCILELSMTRVSGRIPSAKGEERRW
ncbi:hypothetical protein HYDPIDRAFT_110302, partial [Hydnomerulius pinastri MD-312]